VRRTCLLFNLLTAVERCARCYISDSAIKRRKQALRLQRLAAFELATILMLTCVKTIKGRASRERNTHSRLMFRTGSGTAERMGDGCGGVCEGPSAGDRCCWKAGSDPAAFGLVGVCSRNNSTSASDAAQGTAGRGDSRDVQQARTSRHVNIVNRAAPSGQSIR